MVILYLIIFYLYKTASSCNKASYKMSGFNKVKSILSKSCMSNKIVKNDDIPLDNDNRITVKSLLFDINDETHLLILDITRNVDIVKLRNYFNNDETRIDLTEKHKAEAIGGIKMGTVHPLASCFSSLVTKTFIDKDLLKYDDFYSGSGDTEHSLLLNTDDIITLSTSSHIVQFLDFSSIKKSNIKKNDSIKQNINYHDEDFSCFDLNTFINRIRKVSTSTSKIDKFMNLMIQYDYYVQKGVIDITTEEHPLDIPSVDSLKTCLQLACWRGHPLFVEELLNRGCNINAFSKGAGNYGKTALFYALTRCRDDIVLMLLENHANVRIVNNKGQSPRSLSITHSTKNVIEAIEKAEESQKQKWINFHASNSDGQEYGDLDPRFITDEKLNDEVINAVDPRVVKPTNFRSLFKRDEIIERDTQENNASNDEIIDMDLLDNCGKEVTVFQSENKSFVTLPSPGVDGFVEIQGKLISKRHISRTLMFGTVKPISSDNFAVINPDGQQHPNSVGLQLIIGKSLKQVIGEDNLSKFIKKLKVGTKILIQGLYTRNGLPLLEEKEVTSIGEGTSSYIGEIQPLNYNTVDMVVHRVKLLGDDNIDDGENINTSKKVTSRNNNSGKIINSSINNYVTFESLKVIGNKNYTLLLVNDIVTLDKFVTSLLLIDSKKPFILGLDSEWRPTTSGENMNPVSIIQIAFLDEIFIIDLQIMNNNENNMRKLNDALALVFQNKNLSVLGCGVNYDIKRIIESYPNFDSFQKACFNTLDIQGMYKSLPCYQKNSSCGLSAICNQLLGFSIDKEQQISDWSRRPLIIEQLEYAAVDAAILEIIYHKLQQIVSPNDSR